jgi:8-oxo-dGTP pyrophosphatase MutT (NUDIX family)
MSYELSSGIDEKDLSAWLKDAAKKYGTFADGRVDYTHAPIAPTVMCTLKCGDEIFLAKRGYGLADANGYWSTINGFIDEDKSVAEIAANEFKEELGLTINPNIIKVAPSYTLTSQQEKRSYIIFPCLVMLDKKPDVKLDREHTEYAWIKRAELKNYHTLADLAEAIDRALALA